MKSTLTRIQSDRVPTSEVELKFALGKTSTSRLLHHPALAGLLRSSRQHEIHRDRYFDSPDFALARLGLTLRIRKNHGQWRQTVKDSPTPMVGLHCRAEYECVLARPEPDHEQLERTPWAAVFARLRGRLVPAFDIRCMRTVLPLAFADGSRAQLCIDRGQIIGPGATLPIAELEIELDHGHVARLYELARQLACSFHLRIEPRSKAQRGMVLIGAPWRHDAPIAKREFRFKSKESSGEAIARLCRRALEEVFVHAQNASQHDDLEDIHRTRIGLRRVRTLLWLAATLHPTVAVGAADDAVHGLYRTLGGVRNWDVFARDLLAREASAALLPVLESLRTLAATALDEPLIQARRLLQSTPFQDVLLDVAGEACQLEVDLPGHVNQFVPNFVRKIARHDKELRKRIEKLYAQTPAEQHVTRRLARRVRERAEFIADFAGAGQDKKRYLTRLAKLQRALGHLHDWYTARNLLRTLTPSADIRVQAWLDHGQSRAMRASVQASERFLKVPSIWH